MSWLLGILADWGSQLAMGGVIVAFIGGVLFKVKKSGAQGMELRHVKGMVDVMQRADAGEAGLTTDPEFNDLVHKATFGDDGVVSEGQNVQSETD